MALFRAPPDSSPCHELAKAAKLPIQQSKVVSLQLTTSVLFSEASLVAGSVTNMVEKKGTFVGAIMSLTGSALQCGSINSNMFICARVIAGLGIGFVNVLIPSWVSELSEAHDRGSTFSLVFVANFLGIFLANWINFGIRNSGIEFRWRFPLGFMCIPMLMVTLAIFFVPGK
ncbi:hypothetical protein MRB53_039652 [Persea americana]|nr:hypothetical protein MRB53_039652 [Persea americana]